MQPFSVLISIYYKEKSQWLREALDSVFEQTVQPSEIVMVKDGPLTPELDAVLDEYAVKHPIFKFVINDKNLGLGLALRKGVEECSNEIIARMDTDDIIPRDRFEKELAAIEKGCDVVSCWSVMFENEIKNQVALKTRPENHDDIVRLAHRRSPICHAGTMMRKSALLKAGNYEDCHYYEDYQLWVRMILSGAKFYNVQEVLYYVRTYGDLINRKGGWAYTRHELSVLHSFYKMGFYSFGELVRNSSIRICARMVPKSLRKISMRVIWNHKSV
jgi:glycosyltransferase involved in cell wall biosynthesis